MPIPVICPGCKTSFRVSEKFAGKTGPCPKCKSQIKIPAAGPEIKVHAPAPEVKDSKGRSVTAPLPRFEEVMSTRTMVLIGAAVLAVPVVAWFASRALADSKHLLAAAGLAVVSLPLVVAGYKVLRDEEAEPHQGRTLYMRSAICAAIYAVLWGVFYFVPPEWVEDYPNWFFIVPPFLLAGATTAFASLDLDFGSGFFHYCFYLAATVFLAWIIGMPFLSPVTGG
jgi:hypothetical protein